MTRPRRLRPCGGWRPAAFTQSDVPPPGANPAAVTDTQLAAAIDTLYQEATE